MKLRKITVVGFRALSSLEIEIDDYTVLVGANGIGKSSILHALAWLFEGSALERADVHGLSSEDPRDMDGSQAIGEVRVTAEFDSLTTSDRRRLQQYGLGEHAVFTRSWITDSPKSKLFGNALSGPGFQDIRMMTKVGDFRPAYKDLLGISPDLRPLSGTFSLDDVKAAFAEWESDPKHASELVSLESAEVTHMLGIAGSSVLQDCVHLVVVPASTDMEHEAGETGRGTVLSSLVGAIATETGRKHRADWTEKNSDLLQFYADSARDAITNAVDGQQSRINAALAEFVPGASLELTPTIPNVLSDGTSSIIAQLAIGGRKDELSRHGHGVQRALMISLLQALVPDAESLRRSMPPIDGEESLEYEARMNDAEQTLPKVLLVIEEPEIYQHPVRSRAFARVLSEFAASGGMQVLLATHSPYFVSPRQFDAVRRLSRAGDHTVVGRSSVAAVKQASGSSLESVVKAVEKYLPSSFSESFFSERVVLVEGPTDGAIIEALAELLGKPLEVRGVTLVAVESKTALQVPFHILKTLGVDTYVVFDGDVGSPARKHPEDAVKCAASEASCAKATEDVLLWLPNDTDTTSIGSLPTKYGAATVVASRFTCFEDDIEGELAKWPSFLTALAKEGGQLRTKNPMHYRAAARGADPSDVPMALVELVEAICL